MGGVGAGRRPGGGAADAGEARGFRRSRNGLRQGEGFDFWGALGEGFGAGRRPGGGAAEDGGGLRPDPGGCEKTALTGDGQGGGYGWE